jgi:hypothetical protein
MLRADRTAATPVAHYVPDGVFVRITNELADMHMAAAAQANFDPQIWAVNFMGKVCGVWPESVRTAAEPAPA